jgi:hypothetical protein
MISRRREERTTASASIRIWGMDANGKPFSVPASTYDITRFGARIVGVRVPLAPGEIVGVQHGSEKARFRVAWYGRPGSRLEGNVGLQALDWKRHIWGALVQDSVPSLVGNNSQPLGGGSATLIPEVDPLLERWSGDPGPANGPAPTPAPPSPSAIARLVAAERRLANRYQTSAPVEITDPATGEVVHGHLREMSLVGCFIHTSRMFPQRTTLRVLLRPFGMEIACTAQVRHLEPGTGYGVKFTSLSDAARQTLETAIERLASESAAVLVPPQNSPAQSRSQQISSAVERLRRQLHEIESLTAKNASAVEPQLVRSLKMQTEQAEQSAIAIQQWLEFQDNRQNTAPLLSEIETRRLRASTGVLRELLSAAEAANFTVDRPAVAELYAAAVALYRRLAWLAEHRNATPTEHQQHS